MREFQRGTACPGRSSGARSQSKESPGEDMGEDEHLTIALMVTVYNYAAELIRKAGNIHIFSSHNKLLL